MVTLELVLLVHQVFLDILVKQDRMEHQVFLEHRVSPVLVEFLVHQVSPVLVDFPAFPVSVVLVFPVSADIQVHQVLVVKTERQ